MNTSPVSDPSVLGAGIRRQFNDLEEIDGAMRTGWKWGVYGWTHVPYDEELDGLHDSKVE
jgi:hypothetical protein